MESDYSFSLSSRPSKKGINENSTLSECEGVQTYLFSRMKASLLNYDSHSTSGFDVKQHERLQNTDRVLGTGNYVRRGGREKREVGGGRLFQIG